MFNEKVISRLRSELKKQYPDKTDTQYNTVINGLMEFFTLSKSSSGSVPMYSESIDFAWHSFILDTIEYHKFCDEFFGHYLHHTPNENGDNLQRLSASQIENDEQLKTLYVDLCKIRRLNPSDFMSHTKLYYFKADYDMRLPRITLGADVYFIVSTEIDAAKRKRDAKKPFWARKSTPSDYEANLLKKEVNDNQSSSINLLEAGLIGLGGGLATVAAIDTVEEIMEMNSRYTSRVDNESVYTPSPVFSSCSSAPSTSSCSSSSCSSSSCSSSF